MLIRILAFLAATTIRLLRTTWRIELQGTPPSADGPPVIFCFWHGKQAGLLAYPRPRPVAVLSSLSRDGELQARILKSLGYIVHRGSSTRGGARGLRGIIVEMKNNRDAAFAVDGPRGPIYKAKNGAIDAAAQSGGLLVPMAAIASRAWIFGKAWDQYTLPKPFARLVIHRGAALDPLQTTTEQLETAIHALASLSIPPKPPSPESPL